MTDEHRVNPRFPDQGSIAVVTTLSGRRYVGVSTLATGIDYFWKPLLSDESLNGLADPDIYWVVVGKTVQENDW